MNFCSILTGAYKSPNEGSSDVQKKITLLSNPSTILQKLFPHSDHVASLVTDLNEDGNERREKKKSGLVIVASLLSKVPNLGGNLNRIIGLSVPRCNSELIFLQSLIM